MLACKLAAKLKKILQLYENGNLIKFQTTPAKKSDNTSNYRILFSLFRFCQGLVTDFRWEMQGIKADKYYQFLLNGDIFEPIIEFKRIKKCRISTYILEISD